MRMRGPDGKTGSCPGWKKKQTHANAIHGWSMNFWQPVNVNVRGSGV
jgi:hypothetical protein